jgi:hypothetical protein
MLLHTKPNGSAYSAEMAGAANLAARGRTSKSTISTSGAMEEPTPKRISLHSVRLATQNNMGDEDCEFGAGRGNRTPKDLLGPADFKSAASANFAHPGSRNILAYRRRRSSRTVESGL